MSSFYIPKRIKIGFQKREDCFTQKLAYVIYFDDKGKLRKEVSWEGWRDKTISPIEFDNVPTQGFVLNKNIQRGGYDWYSDTVTRIRIYDPRDFEFEITAQNLISVLMHSDCLKKGLQGDYVYCWNNKELVLLPTCSEEYKQATDFTALQGQKVSAKTLKPGFAYLTKNQDTVVYLGRYNWYSSWKNYSRKERKAVKSHIFSNEKGDSIYPKSDVSFLAQESSAAEVTNYAKLLDKFNHDPRSKEIVGYELIPIDKIPKSKYSHTYADEHNMFICDQYGRAWEVYRIEKNKDLEYDYSAKPVAAQVYGEYYSVMSYNYFFVKDLQNPTYPAIHSDGYGNSNRFATAFSGLSNYVRQAKSGHSYYDNQVLFKEIEDMLVLKPCQLHAIGVDGTKCPVKDQYQL